MSIEKKLLQKLIIGLIPVNTEKLEKIEFEQDIKDILITKNVNIHNINPLLFNFLEKSEVIDKWCILFLHYLAGKIKFIGACFRTFQVNPIGH